MTRTRSQSVAVITMVRASEFPTAWSSLKSIEPQLESRIHRFILINDSPNRALQAELEARPFTTVIAPGENLGVARGRNRLISESLEWGADLIISVDDDLLFPRDYVSILLDHYSELHSDGGPVGIVAPVVLDFHVFADAVMTPAEVTEAEQGEASAMLAMEDLRLQMTAAWPDEVPETVIYHAGIRGWRGNYLRFNGGSAGEIRRLFDDVLQGPRLPALPRYELKRDLAVRQSILSDETCVVSVDTLPGGVSMYSADLLREIGLLDESFSPFGFEDSDFAIRAVERGYRNYLLPDVVVLHDLGSRGKERDLHRRLFLEGRSRALMARKHGGDSDWSRMAVETTILGPFRIWDVVRSGQSLIPCPVAAYLAGLGSFVAGWVDGATEAMDGHDVLLHAGRVQRTWPVRLNAWSGTPVKGFPRVLRGTASVALSWVPERGELTVEQLDLDFPGLGRLRGSMRLVNLAGATDGTQDGYLSATVESISFQFTDRDLLRRMEETVSWRRKERSTGYLAALGAGLAGVNGWALRWFLKPSGRGPGAVRVSLRPTRPTSVEQLIAISERGSGRDMCDQLNLEVEVDGVGPVQATDLGEVVPA